jgi:hypothetical protein
MMAEDVFALSYLPPFQMSKQQWLTYGGNSIQARVDKAIVVIHSALPRNSNLLNFVTIFSAGEQIFSAYKRDCVTRFFASGFFPESSSPNPLKITIGLIRIFLKIYICKPSLASMTPVENLLPVSMTPEANFATGAAGVIDTSSKFSHWCQ